LHWRWSPVRPFSGLALAYTEFLELLVADELARRRDRLFTRRLKAGRVPQMKTLENFDWSFNSQIPKALILDLGRCLDAGGHGSTLPVLLGGRQPAPFDCGLQTRGGRLLESLAPIARRPRSR
jgi:hypothetical protein